MNIDLERIITDKKTYIPLPVDEKGGADFNLVVLKRDEVTPHCVEHGAMNKVSPSPPEGGGFWRCIALAGPKKNPCRAGCMEEYHGS
jgi:hypothetical protein